MISQDYYFNDNGTWALSTLDYRFSTPIYILQDQGTEKSKRGSANPWKSLENSKSIDVFPNPASEQVCIKSDEIIEFIQIRDASGKVVYEETFSNSRKLEFIDLSFLAPGAYFLLQNNSSKMAHKIVVK